MTRGRGGHQASADIALVLVAVATMTSVGCTPPADDTMHRATALAAVRNGSTAPASTGCAARPGACGYPDATSTGVQPGVTLKPSGCVSANTAGQVIENLLIVDCEATATNIHVTNNRISRMYYPQGGSYGRVTAYTSKGGNTFTGNIWDDTGSAISAH